MRKSPDECIFGIVEVNIAGVRSVDLTVFSLFSENPQDPNYIFTPNQSVTLLPLDELQLPPYLMWPDLTSDGYCIWKEDFPQDLDTITQDMINLGYTLAAIEKDQ